MQVSGGGPQPTVNAQGNTPLGRLVVIGMIVGLAYESERGQTTKDALSGQSPLPPPLDPARRVLEVDCTKPIDDWSGNLRCR